MPGLAKAYGEYFPIGSAVSPEMLYTHGKLLLEHFNSVTPENHMKPMYIQPSENRFSFEQADKIADWALANGMKLRAHTLVWHNQTPGWFFEGEGGEPATREKVLERMTAHITAAVKHYKGKAYAWDVVNEAVSDDPAQPALRRSRWLEAAGEDYIERAFIAAHEADPDCILFYNDYNEHDPVKSKRIYELIRGLLERGVPVGGIGMQGHYGIFGSSADVVETAIELYAGLGLQLQITEMDISLFRHGDDTSYDVPPQELLDMQTERYDKLFALFRKHRRYIRGVTLWGAADDYTWLSNFPVKNRKNWPLLFDENHQPKAALKRITGHAI